MYILSTQSNHVPSAGSTELSNHQVPCNLALLWNRYLLLFRGAPTFSRLLNVLISFSGFDARGKNIIGLLFLGTMYGQV